MLPAAINTHDQASGRCALAVGQFAAEILLACVGRYLQVENSSSTAVIVDVGLMIRVVRMHREPKVKITRMNFVGLLDAERVKKLLERDHHILLQPLERLQ